jgi:drug/metabolite transporter (DMT)-like permease
MVAILLGALGYAVLNISQAVQKIGLVWMRTRRVQGALIWAAATLGTLASSGLVFAGVALGNASLVGAMAGIGLAALAVFSHFVLKERVGLKEAFGVLVMVLAAGLIGFFASDRPPAGIRLDYLFGLLAAVVAAPVAALLFLRRRPLISGLVIGVLSGCLGGLVPLFQKVSTSAVGTSQSLFTVAGGPESGALGPLLAMFSNPFTVMWILLSLASMLVLQFAYRKNEVIRIIPFFTATSILIPVVGGVLCLGERPHPAQWAGVALIFAGLALLTVKGRRPAGKPQPDPDNGRS